MTSADAIFLRETAAYFRKLDTKGEDRAFWANQQNAFNLERIAKMLDTPDRRKDTTDG
jgi:hypothetical protein